MIGIGRQPFYSFYFVYVKTKGFRVYSMLPGSGILYMAG
jgi:hypothetical protein